MEKLTFYHWIVIFSDDESLYYIFESELSTSNLVNKSWKINRLLTILD